MKALKIFVAILLILNLTSCCGSKKQQKAPAANDILKDRNTRDPKIDSLTNKKVEKALPNMR